jgi:hypothetical protein
MDQSNLALFTLLGQTAQRAVSSVEEIKPSVSIEIGGNYDLSSHMPEISKRAIAASSTYQLFFIFEEYLRDFVQDILSDGQKKDEAEWWPLVRTDIQTEVKKLEDTEEMKKWMSLNARGKIFLLTLPQLLTIIDENWKTHFEELVRDKTLIQQARLLIHLRNTICHMSNISMEENNRIKQVMRDWFRAVAP